jgi:hypothetical protein
MAAKKARKARARLGWSLPALLDRRAARRNAKSRIFDRDHCRAGDAVSIVLAPST